jgi:hypothetical protein
MKKIKKFYIKYNKIKQWLMMAFLINFNNFFMGISESQLSTIDSSMNDLLNDNKEKFIPKVMNENDVIIENDFASENSLISKNNIASEDFTISNKDKNQKDTQKKRNLIIQSVGSIVLGLVALGIVGLGINRNSRKKKQIKGNDKNISNLQQNIGKGSQIKRSMQKKIEQKILPVYDQFNSLDLNLDQKNKIEIETIEKLRKLEYKFFQGSEYEENKKDHKKTLNWMITKKQELNEKIKELLGHFKNKCFLYKFNKKYKQISVIDNNVTFYPGNAKIIDIDQPKITDYNDSLWISTQLLIYNLILQEINKNNREYYMMNYEFSNLKKFYENYIMNPNESSWKSLDDSLKTMINIHNKQNNRDKNKKNDIEKLSDKVYQLILKIKSFIKNNLSLLYEKINDLEPFVDEEAINKINIMPGLFQKLEYCKSLSDTVKRNLIIKIKKIIDIEFVWNITNNNKELIFDIKFVNDDTGLNFNIENQKFHLNEHSVTFPSKLIKVFIDQYCKICCKDHQLRDSFNKQFREKIFQGTLYRDFDNPEIKNKNISLKDNFYFLMAIYIVISHDLDRNKNTKLAKNYPKNIVYNKSFFNMIKFWQHLGLTIKFDGSHLLIEDITDIFSKKKKILIMNNYGTYKADLRKQDIDILNNLKNKNIEANNPFISYINKTEEFDMNSLKEAIVQGLYKNNPSVIDNGLKKTK